MFVCFVGAFVLVSYRYLLIFEFIDLNLFLCLILRFFKAEIFFFLLLEFLNFQFWIQYSSYNEILC